MLKIKYNNVAYDQKLYVKIFIVCLKNEKS